MKLYIVRQWGNNDSEFGGNDSYGSSLLIRAHDRDEAAKCADEVFSALPHERVMPMANVVIEIGSDCGDCNAPRVLLGPVLVHGAFEYGYSTAWNRSHPSDPWVEVKGRF